MNKSVLISIQPKWCELIASGRKTIEVRKSSPTETPFKCYIYMTKSKQKLVGVLRKGDDVYGTTYDMDKPTFITIDETSLVATTLYGKNSKVIGEFVCDRIDEYESEFWNDDTLMQNIRLIERDEEDEDWVDYYTVDGNEYEPMSQSDICKQSCLSVQEIWKYVGVGLNTFYGWHISDLKIYDKPKELGEFKVIKVIRGYHKKNEPKITGLNKESIEALGRSNRVELSKLTRPPQSWCYVEELISD